MSQNSEVCIYCKPRLYSLLKRFEQRARGEVIPSHQPKKAEDLAWLQLFSRARFQIHYSQHNLCYYMGIIPYQSVLTAQPLLPLSAAYDSGVRLPRSLEWGLAPLASSH